MPKRMGRSCKVRKIIDSAFVGSRDVSGGVSAMVVNLFCCRTHGAAFSVAGDDLLRSEHPRYSRI